MQRSIHTNLILYPWYQATTSIVPWIPVFFLFFSETVSLGEAIKLAAVYYFSVFVFEIPSGYFSDRSGRRITLIIAAVLTCSACLAFLTASNFVSLAIGQVLLACGIAFQSGSDNSLLYDSLVQTGEQKQYSTHEARGLQFGMAAMACSCFLGGYLGSINLKLPYVATLAGALATLAISYSFTEPASADGSVAEPFIKQLLSTAGRLRDSSLLWVFLLYIAGYSLEHVPFEFFQPYISLLDSSHFTAFFNSNTVPIVSGIVIGVSMFGGALGARASIGLQNRFGVVTLLLTSIGIQCIIIAGLALWLHPAFLLLIMFRNFAMAMAHGPMLGVIAPRVSSGQRATYLSMQSLAGRLGFSLVLYLLANRSSEGEPLDWVTLSDILRTCAVVGFVALLLLAILAQVGKREIASSPASHNDT